MVYPLLFPHGEPGYSQNCKIFYSFSDSDENSHCTMRKYYSSRIAVRQNFSLLHSSARLFQQYVVDQGVKIQNYRLNYLKNHQSSLRVESYHGVQEYLSKLAIKHGKQSETDERVNIGKMVILPSSFTDSTRYLHMKYQDAISMVREFGKPDLFITFTCNPQWKEITENLPKYQSVENRPDLVARVFRLKYKELIREIVEDQIFGKVASYFGSIEFQKRGLPHLHILLILESKYKLTTAEQVDKVVSAEIPDPVLYPNLHALVMRHMIHGPCGKFNTKSPCMVPSKKDPQCVVCSKHFPKQFSDETIIRNDGYPLYRRRKPGPKGENTATIMKGNRKFTIDNSMVVLYNYHLLTTYGGHINIEICSSLMSVKYLYKYLTKGNDTATFRVVISDGDNQTQINYDEIQQFINTRYVTPPEAVWMIFDFKKHDQMHTVYRLDIHLPAEQCVYFQNNSDQQSLNQALKRESMLTAWFKLNLSDPEANHLNYLEVPYQYVWRDRSWHRRLRREKLIPRLYNTNPRNRELFSLRLLLLHVPGATSFEFLRTVNNHLYPNFSSAASALRLLEDDREWDDCLAEGVSYQMPKQLRQLFAFICISAGSSVDALNLWTKYKQFLCEDFALKLLPDAAESLALASIQEILTSNGLSLKKLGLPCIQYVPSNISSFNIDDHIKICRELESTLNEDQLNFVQSFKTAFLTKNTIHRLFFIDGAAGTGKTHLYNYLFHLLKSKGRYVIACAFTGIAATLLPEGRTIHSAFKLPLKLTEKSISSITSSSYASQHAFIRELDVIIIDEVSMISNDLLDCLNRSLIDICDDKRDFGGKFVIFGGDFRQILPVVPHGTRANIVSSSIKRNPIWKRVRPFQLRKNMRADPRAQLFAKYLLEVGEGKLSSRSTSNPWIVALNEDIIFKPVDNEDNVLRLITRIFSDQLTQKNVDTFAQHVILCPTNVTVMDINNRIITTILEGELHSYFSVDTQDPEGNDEEIDLPIEHIHTLLPNGYPPHELKLKLGTIVIVLRNLSSDEGIVNGTRAIVTNLQKNVIQLQILTGQMKGKFILLPRFDFIHESTDDGISLRFKRRQFPIRPAFAMTINKCQGQTFKKVGIYLDQPIFTHGQLYVAFSRVSNFSSLHVLINPIDKVQGMFNFRPGVVDYCTYNVVYKEILDCLH